jgi:flagellar biosynthesis protein FlhF
MQIHTFVADSAAGAVAQIRETLGPEAVVLNVRRPPVEGLARLWQRPRIEVLAHLPEKPPASGQADSLAEMRAELRELREQLRTPAPAVAAVESAVAVETGGFLDLNEAAPGATRPAAVATEEGGWRVGSLLESSGLLAVHARRVVEELRSAHGPEAPDTLAEEIQMARLHLAGRWRAARGDTGGPHVFIGPPGAGKTTVLCKWLAQTSLVEGRGAAVWRLDGHVANTAEQLSVYGEILGVPVERVSPANGEWPEAEARFVDLPGVNPADRPAMEQLARRLAEWPEAQAHLVLNAAYETPLLLAQARAFAALPVADVIVTHLDEEPRWGRLWNLALGTNCRLSWLAAGQNIPGEFAVATPERILARQFPRNPSRGVARR